MQQIKQTLEPNLLSMCMDKSYIRYEITKRLGLKNPLFLVCKDFNTHTKQYYTKEKLYYASKPDVHYTGEMRETSWKKGTITHQLFKGENPYSVTHFLKIKSKGKYYYVAYYYELHPSKIPHRISLSYSKNFLVVWYGEQKIVFDRSTKQFFKLDLYGYNPRHIVHTCINGDDFHIY